MQRRQFMRQARNAARAVYFELSGNRLNIEVALEYTAMTPLSRSSFDQLLPELATWLEPAGLQTIAAAYMGHTGYEQLRSDADIPQEARRQALMGILKAHDQALELVRLRVFSASEIHELNVVATTVSDSAVED